MDTLAFGTIRQRHVVVLFFLIKTIDASQGYPCFWSHLTNILIISLSPQKKVDALKVSASRGMISYFSYYFYYYFQRAEFSRYCSYVH